MDLRYGTSELFGEKELEAGLSVARTYTSDAADKHAMAHRLYVEYPNDLVEFSASWSRAASNFDPEVGFVRRSGYQRLASELAILPRPEFLPFVQQLEFKPWEVSWYADNVGGGLQSLYLEVVPLAFTLRSGDSFELNVQRRADRPGDPFELFDDAEIPAGEYWFTRWVLELDTYGARALSGGLEVSGGDFYLGSRRVYSASASWRAGRHVSLSADWEHNRIELFGDEFRVDEVSGRLDFAVSPDLFGALAGQWNNEDDEVILNFRLNWIPRPGSDVYLVINELVDAEDARWNPLRTTVLSKLVWRIAL
jgi:hypothetical protein